MQMPSRRSVLGALMVILARNQDAERKLLCCPDGTTGKGERMRRLTVERRCPLLNSTLVSETPPLSKGNEPNKTKVH
ncbi:hypothetical protein DPMN_120785 [Dreissena polymorpha]|uniref:Uncharacterized protein n=1 Tax=Dreissena polymorpha TaxID=45954 RepID=A0A9D4GL61_DREPO|nr:hypothetical protein DPMN_120785 [Dreissena polymorpha]